MKIAEVYNRTWKDRPLTEFESYDRNLLLERFFPVVSKEVTVLDLGCGDGAVSAYLEGRGYLVTACDFNEAAVVAARGRGLRAVRLLNVESGLPFEDSNFDTVFWGDVIEHLFDPEGTLTEIRRVLKSGGRLILSCPNVGYLGFRFKYLFSGSIRSLELAGQAPWEQEHIRFFNFQDLHSLLSQLGFRTRKLVGVNRLWHSRTLARLWPKLFGYIQVVEAIKN